MTRYRYGDEQHLDEALNRIFMLGRPNGIPRRLCPKLDGVREEVTDGQYTLVRRGVIGERKGSTGLGCAGRISIAGA